MREKKKGGGGSKLARTEIVQVRLDPKLRFAAELAARRQRRTLSSFIEWGVGEAIKLVDLDESETAYSAISNIWDVDEADRFAKMAHHYPLLLTHEEEVLWKVVLTTPSFWSGPENNLKNLKMDYFKTCFPEIKKFSRGEITDQEMILKIIESSEDFCP
jgi:hypothetical protein